MPTKQLRGLQIKIRKFFLFLTHSTYFSEHREEQWLGRSSKFQVESISREQPSGTRMIAALSQSNDKTRPADSERLEDITVRAVQCGQSTLCNQYLFMEDRSSPNNRENEKRQTEKKTRTNLDGSVNLCERSTAVII
jgi:hypothetical protein